MALSIHVSGNGAPELARMIETDLGELLKLTAPKTKKPRAKRGGLSMADIRDWIEFGIVLYGVSRSPEGMALRAKIKEKLIHLRAKFAATPGSKVTLHGGDYPLDMIKDDVDDCVDTILKWRTLR